MLDKLDKKDLFTSIENLKGIGPKTLKLFKKICGEKIIDLLLTVPREFKKRNYIEKITDQYLEQDVAIIVDVKNHLPRFNSKMPYKILCGSNGEDIEIIFFRGYTKYLKKIMPEGVKKVVCGKLEKKGKKYQIIHPENISPIEDLKYLHGYLSVYSLTKGLSMSVYRKSITNAIKELIDIPEWINKKIIMEKDRKPWKQTLTGMQMWIWIL